MGAFSLLMRPILRTDEIDPRGSGPRTYPVSGDTEADAIATARKFLPAARFELISALPIADVGLAA